MEMKPHEYIYINISRILDDYKKKENTYKNFLMPSALRNQRI